MNPFIFCFLRAKNTRKSGSESQIFKHILRAVHRFAVHIVHDLQKMQIAAARGGKDDALFPPLVGGRATVSVRQRRSGQFRQKRR